jgi:hypothetical protein
VITGSVWIDLRQVQPDRMHRRAACLGDIPDGQRVLVVVGALKVEPRFCKLLAHHADRLSVTVAGEPHAVRRWLAYLDDPTIDGTLPEMPAGWAP